MDMRRASVAGSVESPRLVVTRRGFVGGAAGLAAGFALAGAGTMVLPRRALAQAAGGASGGEGSTPEKVKFASVTPINTWAGGGVWAIVSDFGMPVTLCNGGIIAGKDAVVVVDGFNTPAGAQWAAKTAKELTGRDPTHVVVTHYHFDHTDGLSGYLALPVPPTIISTRTTRDLMARRGAQGGGNLLFPAPASAVPGLETSVARCVLPDAVIADSSKPLRIDIGGKAILLRERAGHTPSDLNIEIEGGGKDGQKVVFAGDMIFYRAFPVYLDAIPSVLKTNVAEVTAEDGGKSVIVPGHGPLATGADLGPFLKLIDHIAQAGGKAKASGLSAKDAAATFTVPAELKDYTPGNPLFAVLAMEAVYRELEGGGGAK